MTRAQRERLAVLATNCESWLQEPVRQSGYIWRGDMHAIVAAKREIERLEKKLAKAAS